MIENSEKSLELKRDIHLATQSELPIWLCMCLVPIPKQIVPFFMPRFLYYMLYELYDTIASEGDMSTVTTSHLGLYCEMESKLEVCVIIDSSMVNLNMRCKNIPSVLQQVPFGSS